MFRILKLYLLYILITAVLLFAFQTPLQGGEATTIPTKPRKTLDRAALIESGEDGARTRISLVESATSSIDLAYYTIANGEFTHILLATILEAAERGVHVRILSDGFTSVAYERGELRKMIRGMETHPNIEVRYYEKFNLLKPWSWQTCLHEKLIIVDGKLALIGGRNIGDKYYRKKKYGRWFVNDRDALLYAVDPKESVIADMRAYFDQLWEYKHTKTHRKKLSRRAKKRGVLSNESLRAHYAVIQEKAPSLFGPREWKTLTDPTDSVRFVHNPIGRFNGEPACLKALLEMAKGATSSIFVQSPYIIPSRRMRKLMATYAIDYKKATILTNSKQSSPNPIAIAGYFNHRKAITDAVDALYEYQGPDSIHGKSYIFDGLTSAVGTVNLDARSSYINTESMIIITGERFASELKGEVATYIDKSAPVKDDYTYGGKAEDKSPLWLFSKLVQPFEFLL